MKNENLRYFSCNIIRGTIDDFLRNDDGILLFERVHIGRDIIKIVYISSSS